MFEVLAGLTVAYTAFVIADFTTGLIKLWCSCKTRHPAQQVAAPEIETQQEVQDIPDEKLRQGISVESEADAWAELNSLYEVIGQPEIKSGFELMTVKELKQAAKTLEIKGWSKMKKSELLAVLTA